MDQFQKLPPGIIIKGPRTKSGLSDVEIQERLLRQEAERLCHIDALKEVETAEPLHVGSDSITPESG